MRSQLGTTSGFNPALPGLRRWRQPGLGSRPRGVAPRGVAPPLRGGSCHHRGARCRCWSETLVTYMSHADMADILARLDSLERSAADERKERLRLEKMLHESEVARQALSLIHI